VNGHELIHATLSNGVLVPACSCGWWSADGSHAAFERHLRKEREAVDAHEHR